MITGLFGLAVLIAILFPATPTGRWLHRHLVVLPLELARKVERRHIVLGAVLLLGGQALLMAAPLDLALVYAVDLSLYLDAMLGVYAFTATSAVQRIGTLMRTWLTRLRRGAVRRSAPRRRSSRTGRPANDNDGDHAPALRPIAA